MTTTRTIPTEHADAREERVTIAASHPLTDTAFEAAHAEQLPRLSVATERLIWVVEMCMESLRCTTECDSDANTREATALLVPLTVASTLSILKHEVAKCRAGHRESMR